MAFTLLIGLYVSRVVLKELGSTDFGIYNVVGGIVGLFVFVNSALSYGTQRFLNYHMADENHEVLKKIFSAAFLNHLLIAVIIVIISESIGLWLLHNKLVIPEARMFAANWVFQLSIIAAALLVIRSPYNAILIAHEKMDVYAAISIIEVTLKLLLVIALKYASYDKLIVYAVLILLVSITVNLIFQFYCRYSFRECKITLHRDFVLYRKLFSFSSWAFLGGAGHALSFQGVNIVLNMFFGPSINAARGISFQVNNVVIQFLSSFQLAVKPQMVKRYAENRIGEMFSLLFSGIKFSLILVWLILLPVYIEIDYLFTLWLGEYPEYTVVFARIVLIRNLFLCFETPLTTVNGATGENKLFNITTAFLLFLSLPLSYVFLLVGFSPISVYIIDLLIYLVMTVIKLFLLKNQINFDLVDIVKKVILPFVVIGLISFVVTTFFYYHFSQGFFRLVVICCFSTVSIIVGTWFIGCDDRTRNLIKMKAKEFVKCQ